MASASASSKWKSRLDRFKGVNFDPYINDGTVIGHYMIDEPNDPANWGGQARVERVTLEEMAKYSKDRGPTWPPSSGWIPKYLRQQPPLPRCGLGPVSLAPGNVDSYAREMVSEAQRKGVQLIVGLNILKGGAPNGSPMTRERGRGFRLRPAGQHLSLRLHQLEVHLQLHEQQQHQERHEQPSPKAESRGSKSCRS